MSEMKIKTRKRLGVILCAVLFLALQILISLSSRFGLASYNGVFMAFQFITCLVMVRVDYRLGARVSMVLIGISILSMLCIMLFAREMGPLPGFCNMILYFVIIVKLSRQFEQRDMEAVTDDLTGLQNRRGLFKYLRALIEEEKPFYVLYLDLENFKMMNDNYGHEYGDLLLRKMAVRIQDVVGENGFVSRIGGDEFVILLQGECDGNEYAGKLCERISNKASLLINGTRVDVYLTSYIGISQYPFDAKDAETLIKYADIAMYEASKEKTRHIIFFDQNMSESLSRQMEVEKLVKEALEQDYFYLVYQPQYRINSKKLRGFEALLRLKTPDGQNVSPGEFIPVAEKGDLILKIDDYVLRRAMTEFCDLLNDPENEIMISVNISSKNIVASDFPEKIRRILKETGFSAKKLEIEITEYCLVQSVDVAIENIQKLRDMGIQIALDDFGTGYTSLSYLAKMPINLLKIDKSLVDDIETNTKSRDFVTAVISMGHLMGCEVISEGVESNGQLSMLADQYCDFVQGFVWGRPLPYEDAIVLTLQAD